jgi:hypothetical protein
MRAYRRPYYWTFFPELRLSKFENLESLGAQLKMSSSMIAVSISTVLIQHPIAFKVFEVLGAKSINAFDFINRLQELGQFR